MEELLVILIQVLVEIVLDCLIYLPWDTSFYKSGKAVDNSGCAMCFAYLSVGAACGWLSLLIVPKLVLGRSVFRLGSLILNPMVAGASAWALATLRNNPTRKLRPPIHFFFAFCFVLAFGAIRLAYGTR